MKPRKPFQFNIGLLREALTPKDPGLPYGDIDRVWRQNDNLLAALRAGKRITVEWAWEHGITRLAARIWDLRQAGCRIKSSRLIGGTCEYWMEPHEREKHVGIDRVPPR